MIGVPQIKNLENLVAENIEKTQKIVEAKVTKHVFASEFFGTTILEIDILVNDETKYTQEILRVAAKLIPERELYQRVLNSEVTFKKEVAFYKNVVPALESFKREMNIVGDLEFLPKFYGGRLNLLENNENVDRDAVLIFEQLLSKGKTI